MMHASKYQYFSCGKPEARSLKLVIDSEENVENKAENTASPTPLGFPLLRGDKQE